MIRPVCGSCGGTAVYRRERADKRLIAWRCEKCWKYIKPNGETLSRVNENSDVWLSEKEVNAELATFNKTVKDIPLWGLEPASPAVSSPVATGSCRICGSPGSSKFKWLSTADNGWDYLCRQHQSDFIAEWGDIIGVRELLGFAVSDMGATVV